MEKWKISEAKAKLTALLTSCIKEPQIICNREKPVAVVINVKLFEELMQIKKKERKPSMAELLEELRSIREIETVEIEIPERKDRANPMETTENEMAL